MGKYLMLIFGAIAAFFFASKTGVLDGLMNKLTGAGKGEPVVDPNDIDFRATERLDIHSDGLPVAPLLFVDIDPKDPADFPPTINKLRAIANEMEEYHTAQQLANAQLVKDNDAAKNNKIDPTNAQNKKDVPQPQKS